MLRLRPHTDPELACACGFACPFLLLLLLCRMAQVLESLHRADRAVVVLQDALKGPANAVDPATTRGHELTHGANALQLSTADRRKFEDMLATAQVSTSLRLRWLGRCVLLLLET